MGIIFLVRMKSILSYTVLLCLQAILVHAYLAHLKNVCNPYGKSTLLYHQDRMYLFDEPMCNIICNSLFNYYSSGLICASIQI